jgi:hypothetical protein
MNRPRVKRENEAQLRQQKQNQRQNRHDANGNNDSHKECRRHHGIPTRICVGHDDNNLWPELFRFGADPAS